MKKDMEHCYDCGVCIEDYDHHCVFFSKCIGGGNIIPFWGTMAMLIVNFICIAITVAMDASINDTFNQRVREKCKIK
jgi:palmitoyltransferase ZDHHC9/14/18/palmitoyltransferase